ncbi:hypothetical protein TPHA_0C03420 [Tetrapisispora phaffii CBS 4417]|uniref:37S ribosomal protein S25, mitochondrial n=1 Tax=Tetrapisispora phaffii (strain ATCC 24235 / CBS 4417 / NBRC 1672 / NRRL Y-8282 / UCD 70-5) TaxID=1071381 RepID=G8BRW8_TETPH|nr:mitochondrial 37S ribosomal protein RSM25 TPHA_0C03420 [Tetrapisispora phaffii CBS 4417]CCE62494.1 hypothetical protein TPHA_0C03420 [Tetrapisispora phaffii CBS 4417]
MKIQQNAVNVLERTSSYLRSGLLTKQPAWYNVVAEIPPSKKFERTPKFTNPSNNKKLNELRIIDERLVSDRNGTFLFKSRYNKLDKKSSSKNVYKPAKLSYIEDQLREVFYIQHPWELSRPKIVVENNGDETYDWSHIQQLGKALDGENVVQRAMYLMKKKLIMIFQKHTIKARYEFYRVRMQSEIEEQVAQEEAEMFGSVFGPSTIEFGMDQEQKVIDVWKRKAIAETELMEAKRTNPSETWAQEKEEDVNYPDGEQITEEATGITL